MTLRHPVLEMLHWSHGCTYLSVCVCVFESVCVRGSSKKIPSTMLKVCQRCVCVCVCVCVLLCMYRYTRLSTKDTTKKSTSHGTLMNASWHTYEFVMAHMWMRQKELFRADAYVMASVWMRRSTHINESWGIHEQIMTHIWMNRSAHMKESWRTYAWIMAHTYEWVRGLNGRFQKKVPHI